MAKVVRGIEDVRLEYPHLEKRLNMLRLLSNALDEVCETHGEQQLMLSFSSRGSESGILVYRTRQDVAKDLNLSGAEALGLLNELGSDGYLHLDHGKLGPNASAGIVNVRLREKGHAAIEQLPDPNKEFLEVLDAIAAAIEGLQEVEPEQKTKAQKALGELKTFGRGITPAASIEIIKTVIRVLTSS